MKGVMGWAALGALWFAGCGQVPPAHMATALSTQSCYSCHGDIYLATTAPDHAAGGFPTTCEACHTTAAWQPASGAEHDFWPLTGAHATTSCMKCHADGFQGTPTECESCHMPDYEAAQSPNHVASQLPTACASCHTTEAWTPASFNHDEYWPLEGKHATTSCAACHVDNQYAGTPRQCVGCHQQDYDQTTSPSHSQLGLATTCGTCHSQDSWSTNTFPGHDPLFPISTGRHRQFKCSECHTTANTYSDFTCTGCHSGEHNKPRMDNKHQGEVWNYQSTLNQYGVQEGCLHCHPLGIVEDD